MVLNGILPVSQLKDHVPSIKILLDYIPTHVLEYIYGLVLPQVLLYLLCRYVKFQNYTSMKIKNIL